MLLSLLNAISIIAWALYIGPMVAFTVLFILHSQIKSVSLKGLVDTFMLWGAGFGLSLGALIFSLLLSRWQQYGEFVLYWSQTSDHLQTSAITIAFLAWISNMVLEVWTLDPLRKLSERADTPEYLLAFEKLRRHMVVHSLLWLIAGSCYIISLSIAIEY